MFLHTESSLPNVSDLSPERVEHTLRNVQLKKQRLEDDIARYIQDKQAELRKYEQEVLKQNRRATPVSESNRDSEEKTADHTPLNNSKTPPSPPKPEEPSQSESTKLGPDEAAKKTKHTRVHKREKELCGLVTPFFLPLLDASETTSPVVKKKKSKSKVREEKEDSAARNLSLPGSDPTSSTEHVAQTRDGEKRKSKASSSRDSKMENVESTVARSGSESSDRSKKREGEKKGRRSSMKKPALRQNSDSKSCRKRVSLVVDDQIVHPADSVAVTSPISPHSESNSNTASTSTSSLESTLDPRLVSPHTLEPIHHSLPMPLPTAPPTTAQNLSASPPPLEYEPPQSTTRTYLDPPPNDDMDIPQTASAHPIFADDPIYAEEAESEFIEEVTAPETTYVGGMSGSGVDNVDQAGSYGYPSSLGASYMESYMKSRPLSVRIAAAEKAGLAEEEKKALIAGEKNEELEFRPKPRVVEAEDAEDEFMGSMDDF